MNPNRSLRASAICLAQVALAATGRAGQEDVLAGLGELQHGIENGMDRSLDLDRLALGVLDLDDTGGGVGLDVSQPGLQLGNRLDEHRGRFLAGGFRLALDVSPTGLAVAGADLLDPLAAGDPPLATRADTTPAGLDVGNSLFYTDLHDWTPKGVCRPVLFQGFRPVLLGRLVWFACRIDVSH